MALLGRPNGARLHFATDKNYTSGAVVGTPTKIDPLSGEQAEGLHPSKRPPAQKLNALIASSLNWADYLADMPLMNWGKPQFVDIANNALDLSYTREHTGG